jgi:hypothetical protein
LGLKCEGLILESKTRFKAKLDLRKCGIIYGNENYLRMKLVKYEKEET